MGDVDGKGVPHDPTDWGFEMKSPPPPARLLAEMCILRAWDDDTDDQSRLLLEQAHEVLVTLADRLESQARCLEHIETRIEQLEAKP